MRIPLHWAQASAPATDRWRRRTTVTRWGWSDTSAAAAQQHAQTRLDDALRRYGREPGVRARESLRGYDGENGLPICEEILDTRGNAVLTRNVYGAQCLNTPNALFVDIDHPEHGITSDRWDDALVMALLFLASQALAAVVTGAWRFLVMAAIGMAVAQGVRRLRLRRKHQRVARERAQDEPHALARIRAFVRMNRGWGGRIYRSPAGLRVLFTHRPFDPLEPETRACFTALGADPAYQRLCAQQRCFRARVSAKPWRAGVRAHLPPSGTGRGWPVPPRHARQRQDWVAEYEKTASAFAACHFIEAVGSPHIDPAIQPTLDWHDTLSRAHSALPLA